MNAERQLFEAVYAGIDPLLTTKETAWLVWQEARNSKVQALKFNPQDIPLPSFIPRDAWVEWCIDRRDRRKPISKRGAVGQIKQLAAYRAQGHEAAAVIANSIAGGYQGLFPPKASTNSEPGWRSEQRERTQLAAPGVAARSPAQEFFEAEARNVTPHRLG